MAGRVTHPAEISARVIARVINGLLALGVYLWLSLGAYTMVTNPNEGDSGIIMVMGLLVAMSIGVWQLVAVVKRSTTVGGRQSKICYIDTRTGRPMGVRLLIKLAVQTLFEVATLGLGAISYFFNYRNGQHWLDRSLHVAAVEDGGR